MKSILIQIVLAIVFLGIGLGGGIGYGRYQLNQAEEAHTLVLEKMERKINQWQKNITSVMPGLKWNVGM